MLKKSKKGSKILFGIAIVIIVILIIISKVNENELDNNKSIATGKPLKVWYINFNYKYDYEFYVSGIRYEGRSGNTLLKPEIVLSSFYYVEYQTDNPANSRILFDNPINSPADSIK